MKLEKMPRAPLLHALILVILVIGASDAKRLSAPTSSNETASNETALKQPASNETASKQPASNETASKQPASNGTALKQPANRTRLASEMHLKPDGHWTYRRKETKEKDICVEVDPCRSECTCQKVDVDAYYCKYNITQCEKDGEPCYNGHKKAGDCCKSCPNGPNCLIWETLLKPGEIYQNPGNKSEYAMCGKSRIRIFQITEWSKQMGLAAQWTRTTMFGARYPVKGDTQ